MKVLLVLLLLIPALLFGEEERSDDHNTIPPGIVSKEQILSELEIYRQRYLDYTPQAEALQQIRDCKDPVEIKLVFGDWCKDSKKHVPAFLKTMELAANKNIQVLYINVDRQKHEPADLLEGLKVESVPTWIVYADGKEAGRIIETPKASVEQDLAQILAGIKR